MDPMLEAFISESRDNLETAGRCFLELENRPGDDELMNDLFRSMHTIKGSSGLFDIPSFTKVVHAAEDVLDSVRAGDLVMVPEHIDLFLDTMDQVSAWLDDLETNETLGDGADSRSQVLVRELRALLKDVGRSDSGPVGSEPESQIKVGESDTEEGVMEAPPVWLSGLPDDDRLDLCRRAKNEELDVLAIEYDASPQCFFSGEDPLHIVRSLPGLTWFQVRAREPWPKPVDMDPYQCNLVFHAVAAGAVDDIRHHLRYVSESCRVMVIAPEKLADTQPQPDKGSAGAASSSPLREGNGSASKKVSSDARLDAVRQALLVQQQILSMPCPPELLAGRISSVAKVVSNILSASDADAQGLDGAVESSLGEKSPSPLLEFVNGLVNRSKSGGAVSSSVSEQDPDNTKGDGICNGKSQEKGNFRDRQGANRDGDVEKAGSGTVETAARSKTLKVDQQRIDALMDLVGELVVAKNAMPFLARRAENDFGVRLLAKEIKAQYAVINRLAEELQGAVMQMRMVPVSSVFQRFPRLVRDLSRKLGKRIQLVLEGEDTEADKNVVENLADPLIHLVRNSLDHGLETAEEREAAGKSAEGTIVLRAIPHDDQVVIEVVDDGCGIDPEVIKRKAYEKGVIDEQRLDSISDHDALQLIFAAGFSTAEEVSDLSGRGVGMDVVRSAVMQAGGTVKVESKKGVGTTIRLSLPLSMAVTRVMMVEVSSQCYGISMENIVETVRIPATDIQRIKHSEAVVLRGQLIPLFYLNKLLRLDADEVTGDEVAILVMKVSGQEIGLVIDEFHEGLDIIQKPLEGVMANYPWFSGAALLGDGRVLLVLNIRELLSCR